MLKNIKVALCLVFAFVMMFSFMSTNAMATDTKTVTLNVEKTFTCTGPQISGNMQLIVNSTYNYNDGTYKGTLNYSRVTSWTSKKVGVDYNNMDVLQVTVGVEYTGTVTRYELAPTKVVTVTDVQSFTCPGSQISNYMQSVTKSTYSYDDGNYRGSLSYSRCSEWKSTLVAENQYGSIYKVDLKVEYTGTVTFY